jgi:ATP-dependent Lhr-like helicase
VQTEPRAATQPEALEHAAKALLRRYGVINRRLVKREPLTPKWRELLPFYRKAEARGEIRGGRFVEPFGGEQFALIEAVEELRRLRRNKNADEWLALSAVDPVNLVGVLDDSPRTSAPHRRIAFKNGVAIAAHTGAGIEWLVSEVELADRRAAESVLAPEPTPRTPSSREALGSLSWARR